MSRLFGGVFSLLLGVTSAQAQTGVGEAIRATDALPHLVRATEAVGACGTELIFDGELASVRTRAPIIAMLSEASCSDLFSPRPPASLMTVVTAERAPEGMVFSTPLALGDGPLQEDHDLLARLSQSWSPICTMVGIAGYRSRQRPPFPPNRSREALRSFLDHLIGNPAVGERGMDACALASADPSILRSSNNHVAESASARSLSPMSHDQRVAFAATLDSTRTRVANNCCLGLADSRARNRCLRSFQELSVRFCEPAAENPCTDGAFYDATDATTSAVRRFRASAPYRRALRDAARCRRRVSNSVTCAGALGSDLLENAPVGVGEIVLSPLLRANGAPMDDLSTLAHELGHACSSIQRQLAVTTATTIDAAEAIYDHMERGWLGYDSHDRCASALPESDVRVNQAMFRQVAGSGVGVDEMFSCLVQVSRAITRQRFHPEASCPQGCPGNAIEETFAEMMNFMSIPDYLVGSETLANGCAASLRDNEHPLPADTLACMMLNPPFRERMERITRCRR